MPKGPGTYGKKRGRPPKKPIRGYSGGGLVKKPPSTPFRNGTSYSNGYSVS